MKDPIIQRKCQKDIRTLTDIQERFHKIQLMSGVSTFETKAHNLAIAIKYFQKIVRNHPEIEFKYSDVLDRDVRIYGNEQIAVINLFTGSLELVTFDNMVNHSNQIFLKSGDVVEYPSDGSIEPRNTAIGQAIWNDVEVYAPRLAIDHSLYTDSKRIFEWVNDFKYKMEKEMAK